MAEPPVAYAAQCLRAGRTPDEVRAELLQQGWDEGAVAEALEGAAVLSELPEPRLAPMPEPSSRWLVVVGALALVVVVFGAILWSGSPAPAAEPTPEGPSPEGTPAPTAAPRPQPSAPAPSAAGGRVKLIGVEVRAKNETELRVRELGLDALRLVYDVASSPDAQTRLETVQRFIAFCRGSGRLSPELERDLEALDRDMRDYQDYLETNNEPKAAEVLQRDIFGRFYARRVEGPLPVTVSLGFGSSVSQNLTSRSAAVERNTVWETSHLVVPTAGAALEKEGNLPIDKTRSRLAIVPLYLDRAGLVIPALPPPAFAYYGKGEPRPLSREGFSIASLEGALEYRVGGEVCTEHARTWSAGAAAAWQCERREKEEDFLARKGASFAFLDLGPVLANLTAAYRVDLATRIGGVEQNFTFLFLEGRAPLSLEGSRELLALLGLAVRTSQTEGTASCPVHVVNAYTTTTTPVHYVTGVMAGQYMMVMYADDIIRNPLYLRNIAESACSS